MMTSPIAINTEFYDHIVAKADEELAESVSE